MNSSPGSSDHFGAATRFGILMGNCLASGARTFSGSRADDLLAEAVLGFELGAIGPGRSFVDQVALPVASVVRPCSATTSPSSQVLGFDGIGLQELVRHLRLRGLCTASPRRAGRVETGRWPKMSGRTTFSGCLRR